MTDQEKIADSWYVQAQCPECLKVFPLDERVAALEKQLALKDVEIARLRPLAEWLADFWFNGSAEGKESNACLFCDMGICSGPQGEGGHDEGCITIRARTALAETAAPEVFEAEIHIHGDGRVTEIKTDTRLPTGKADCSCGGTKTRGHFVPTKE